MRRTLIILVITFILSALSPLACAKTRLDDINREEGLLTEIPFQLHGSMILMKLSIDESAPLTFIFDTGAGGTAINTNTATRLGITGDEVVSREGATGSADVLQSTDHSINAGDLELRDVTLGIVEINHLEKRFGIPIDGIIGWAILSQYAVRINYDTMLIEIYDNRKYEYDSDDSGYLLEVKGTTIFTSVTVTFQNGNTFSGKVLVDTGSGGTISFNTPFINTNGLLDEMDTYYERETMSLSTESSRIYITMIASLTIGKHQFSTLPANMAIAETGALSWSGPMGILGNEVLKRFNIFINLQQNMMSLEPNQLYRDQFEINCSGLELVTDNGFQKVIIDHIYKDSPAQKAGMEVGDEIVQVNGTNVSGCELSEIRKRLSQGGEDIEIMINRKGELYNYRLKLQPLIE